MAAVGSSSSSQRALSPGRKTRASGGNGGGSVKQKKVERKAREQLTQTLQELSDWIGKLEDRDTQQTAFQSLLQRLPQLSASLVGDCFSLIERNKQPSRCSTRRMLVLLIAALCKCHPLQCSKLLARVTAYIGTRLRDNEAVVTDACGILVSSIALHVLQHCCGASATTRADDSDQRETRVESADIKWRDAFESVASPLLKDANAVGENAVRCVCALLRPTEFDGHSLPSTERLCAHASHVHPFFRAVVSAAVAKLNGSTVYASFSPTFLLLKAACEVASDARMRASASALSTELVPFVGFVVEAIEDAFQYGPRDDWVLRKRGVELLTLLIDGFGLSDDASAVSAVEYFRAHLDRVRNLVLSGRQDPVSSVREAAVATVAAFDALNKRFGGLSPVRGGTPLPVQRAALSDLARTATSTTRLRMQQRQDAAARELDYKATAPERTDASVQVTSANDCDDRPDDQDFGDAAMDEAAAPEQLADNDDSAQQPPPQQQQQSSERSSHTRSAAPAALAPAAPLQQFVAKARVHTPQQQQQRSQPLPFRRHRPRFSSHHALSEAKSLDELDFGAEINTGGGDMSERPDAPDTSPERDVLDDDDAKATADNDAESEPWNDELAYMSRADAALHAAQCEEADLALRLCLLEDDVALLKQVLGVIGTPCMHELSRASRSALCAAFLEILDAATDVRSAPHDQWLVLAWLRDLALRRASVQQVDPRVLRALEQRLVELSNEPSRAGLEAARVLAQLGF